MLKDHNHDLVQQLSEISDSLWRMESYISNSEDCSECQSMWKTIKEDCNRHVEMLRGEIAKHAKEGRFD